VTIVTIPQWLKLPNPERGYWRHKAEAEAWRPSPKYPGASGDQIQGWKTQEDPHGGALLLCV